MATVLDVGGVPTRYAGALPRADAGPSGPVAPIRRRTVAVPSRSRRADPTPVAGSGAASLRASATASWSPSAALCSGDVEVEAERSTGGDAHGIDARRVGAVHGGRARAGGERAEQHGRVAMSAEARQRRGQRPHGDPHLRPHPEPVPAGRAAARSRETLRRHRCRVRRTSAACPGDPRDESRSASSAAAIAATRCVAAAVPAFGAAPPRGEAWQRAAGARHAQRPEHRHRHHRVIVAAREGGRTRADESPALVQLTGPDRFGAGPRAIAGVEACGVRRRRVRRRRGQRRRGQRRRGQSGT